MVNSLCIKVYVVSSIVLICGSVLDEEKLPLLPLHGQVWTCQFDSSVEFNLTLVYVGKISTKF